MVFASALLRVLRVSISGSGLGASHLPDQIGLCALAIVGSAPARNRNSQEFTHDPFRSARLIGGFGVRVSIGSNANFGSCTRQRTDCARGGFAQNGGYLLLLVPSSCMPASSVLSVEPSGH